MSLHPPFITLADEDHDLEDVAFTPTVYQRASFVVPADDNEIDRFNDGLHPHFYRHHQPSSVVQSTIWTRLCSILWTLLFAPVYRWIVLIADWLRAQGSSHADPSAKKRECGRRWKMKWRIQYQEMRLGLADRIAQWIKRDQLPSAYTNPQTIPSERLEQASTFVIVLIAAWERNRLKSIVQTLRRNQPKAILIVPQLNVLKGEALRNTLVRLQKEVVPIIRQYGMFVPLRIIGYGQATPLVMRLLSHCIPKVPQWPTTTAVLVAPPPLTSIEDASDYVAEFEKFMTEQITVRWCVVTTSLVDKTIHGPTLFDVAIRFVESVRFGPRALMMVYSEQIAGTKTGW
jgi:hypothetical protein